MISDGETKSASHDGEESHAFPLLNDGLFNDRTDGPKGHGDGFRPLFNNACTGDVISHQKGIGVSRPDSRQKSEDQARRQGYKRGFDAGSQDACNQVRQEMAPQIKSFADAFNRWNEVMLRIEENSKHQILKMTVSIVEKILGEKPECPPDRLESLKDALRERMHKAYQFEFRLNPADMDTLSGMMNCEQIHWGQWSYITASGDAEVKSGSLLVQPGARTISDDDEILLSLDASLNEVSTK